LCHRCSTEGGACPISKRCPGWCDQAGCGDGFGCTCPSVPSLGAARAAEETRTDLPASEVVNTTTAGFITAGLAEIQDLACAPSDDCESEYYNNKDALCHRCSTEGGACPISKRCPGWCDQAGCGDGFGCTCPSVPSLVTQCDLPGDSICGATSAICEAPPRNPFQWPHQGDPLVGPCSECSAGSFCRVVATGNVCSCVSHP